MELWIDQAHLFQTSNFQIIHGPTSPTQISFHSFAYQENSNKDDGDNVKRKPTAPPTGQSESKKNRRGSYPTHPALRGYMGFEDETVRAYIIGEALIRGIELIKLARGKLEVDAALYKGQIRNPLEGVSDGLKSPLEVDEYYQELMNIFDGLYQEAKRHPGEDIPLSSIIENSRLAKDAVIGPSYALRTGILIARQLTSLFKHELLPEALIEIDPACQKVAEENMRKVNHHFQGYCHRSLSPQVLGTLNSVLYVIERAKTGPNQFHSVHSLFNFMSRQTYCFTYDCSESLTEQDRKDLASVLSSKDEEDMPVLMQALGYRDKKSPLFVHGYSVPPTFERIVQGPTIKDWLASIIQGSHDQEYEGKFERTYKIDRISPPDHYDPEPRDGEGKRIKRHGMGEMGGDPRGILAEVRNYVDKLRVVPASFLRIAAILDWKKFQRFNPNIPQLPFPESDPNMEKRKIKLLQDLSYLHLLISNVVERLEGLNDVDPAKMNLPVLKSGIDACRKFIVDNANVESISENMDEMSRYCESYDKDADHNGMISCAEKLAGKIYDAFPNFGAALFGDVIKCWDDWIKAEKAKSSSTT